MVRNDIVKRKASVQKSVDDIFRTWKRGKKVVSRELVEDMSVVVTE